MAKKEGGLPVVRMTTNRGAIDVELFAKDAPKTVENFLKLTKQGYYNGLHWHRVISDFMVQGGCPHSRAKGNSRAGTGGPGYTFGDEIRGNPRRHGAKVLSMANAGPNTNGSQFFITHSPQPHLDGKHTVFGHVVAGESVVDAIRQWDEIQKVDIVEGA
ncbi:MAG TPA: peptidylprolyl isomerase [Candidatus Thermoplasmatota archaeon]|nr:peptidylprolyl isomerase [Candidatus Thermoplasmatota archaeon]